MEKKILDVARTRMKKAEQALQRELGQIRAGKANASMLDRVQVEYYGVPTPVNQLATVSTPEARMLIISPYDKNILGDIEKAIYKSDLGITPTNDGNVIRLVIPALTQERRKELVKQVGKETEKAKIAIRNIRRDAMDDYRKAEKDKTISEDELHSYENQVQELTDASTATLDKIAETKEQELLVV